MSGAKLESCRATACLVDQGRSLDTRFHERRTLDVKELSVMMYLSDPFGLCVNVSSLVQYDRIVSP
jgi:hypothetical protein